MKRNMLIGAALAALVVAAGSVALAQGAGHGHGQGAGPMQGMRGEGPAAMFAEFDADGDGRVTAEEIAAFRSARFDALDADGDGAVSRQEFMDHAAARAGGRAGEMFDRFDADGDGVLSRDAIEARQGAGADGARFIERFDTDGDGAVTEAEVAAARDGMRGRMQERMERHGGEGGRMMQRRHGGRHSDG